MKSLYYACIAHDCTLLIRLILWEDRNKNLELFILIQKEIKMIDLFHNLLTN